ncbi:MAG: hypothetical protein ABIG45_00520 [Bacillota bacterium]
MSPERKKHVKPLLAVLSLLAVIAISMLGITLSAYVKELQLFSNGWLGPKYFAFETQSDGSTKSLAPGESVTYDFTVCNHDGNGVSQVPLHVSIEIDYPGQLAGSGAIQAELLREGSLLASDQGTGSLAVTGATLPAGTATTDHYTLKLTWVDSDMVYLGELKSTEFDPSVISIRVSGYQ